MIEIERTGDGKIMAFVVMVQDATGESRHQVTMASETWVRLTRGRHEPERCVEAAFQFLLEREPKEAILARFDIAVIQRYFPEFERELPRFLEAL